MSTAKSCEDKRAANAGLTFLDYLNLVIRYNRQFIYSGVLPSSFVIPETEKPIHLFGPLIQRIIVVLLTHVNRRRCCIFF